MRFMMLIYPNIPQDAQWAPTPETIEVMGRFNQQLSDAGVLLALDGLHGTREGARVAFTDAGNTVTDGPFAEAKEILGGYWMINVASREEAVGWASRCPASPGQTIEVRRVQELEDFPPEVRDLAGLKGEPPAAS
ncbi:MAG TPA: YciI family protein [Solirubrobacteraceae bacterium]|jgi:hypothetical protein|nr:YciI family protein [Solirubrobacteraceae bacterium]